MRKLVSGVLTSAFVMAAMPAQAATGNVVFNGTVAAICVLQVNDGTGDLAVDAATLSTMSSTNPGGSAGALKVITTGGVALSVAATGTAGVTWTPSYSSTGAFAIAVTSGSTTLASAGTDTLLVNVSGSMGGGPFTAGSYNSTVTVTCQ